MKTLIPLDGSGLAEEALQFASPLAGEELVLVRVVDVSSYGYPHPMLAAELRQRLEAEARAYLEVTAARQPHPCQTCLRVGDPTEEIVGVATAEKVERILLSSRGRTGMARFLMGSVAERVCRSAPCPVWLLPARRAAADSESHRDPRLTSVLVPLDGSEESAAALDYAAHLPGEHRAVLFRATELYPGPLSSPHDEARAELIRSLRDPLEARAEPLRQAGWTVDCIVQDGFAANGILELAQERQVDGIVMGTHGRQGWKRFVLGSVAEMVARYSDRPVVLVNPHWKECLS